jgi:hypothetical protein
MGWRDGTQLREATQRQRPPGDHVDGNRPPTSSTAMHSCSGFMNVEPSLPRAVSEALAAFLDSTASSAALSSAKTGERGPGTMFNWLIVRQSDRTTSKLCRAAGNGAVSHVD